MCFLCLTLTWISLMKDTVTLSSNSFRGVYRFKIFTICNAHNNSDQYQRLSAYIFYWPTDMIHWSADLLRVETTAQRADGLSMLTCLLLDLQQLRSLYDGLQSGCSFTLVQVVCSQPFLHLAGVVPAQIHAHAVLSYCKYRRSPP